MAESRKTRKYIWFFVILGVLLLIAGLVINFSEETSQVIVSEPVINSNPYYVPSAQTVDHSFNAVARIPWVNESKIRETLGLLTSMKGSPELTTPDDIAIYDLLEYYQQDPRRLRVIRAEIRTGTLETRMAYNFVEDRYSIGHIQANIELLAVSFYHELMHAVEAQRRMKRHGFTNRLQLRNLSFDRYDSEARAYAAQVRFFLALYNQGKLPAYVSSEETSDAGLFSETMEVWTALLEGSDSFRRWYETKLMEGNATSYLGEDSEGGERK